MANKKKRCLCCKNYGIAEDGIQLPAGWFIDMSHAITYANSKRDKQKAKEKVKAKQSQAKAEKDNRKALREFNRKDLKWQHKQTQPSFNKMRVLEELKWFEDRNLVPTCISCNKPNMDWCCGHFKTRGSQSNLRYSKINTYLQCNRYCNMGLSGNIPGNKTTRGYTQGLIERFGEEKAKEIIDFCESNTKPIKWTWEELEKMRSSFNQRIRELEVNL